jgi:hypothetical protein
MCPYAETIFLRQRVGMIFFEEVYVGCITTFKGTIKSVESVGGSNFRSNAPAALAAPTCIARRSL